MNASNQTLYVITYYHSNGNRSTLKTTQPSWDAAHKRAEEHAHRAIKAGRITMFRTTRADDTPAL